ncbi:MAG: dienelactone hydrolase family protein, partial [Aureliella sp.]
MNRKQASDFAPEVLELYDDYAHGRLDRREYVKRLAAFAVGGLTVEALMTSLRPNYAWAQQVKPDDARIKTEIISYQSPRGGGEMKGLLARPAEGQKFPAVLVIHENRGLNPYIEDVARRLAADGFLALAPDALTPLGGYPGNDDEGRAMQAKRDANEMTQDFIAAARWLDTNELSTGKVGVVGFCYGGGIVNQLAVLVPDVIDAGVPFYGRQPDVADVPKINAPLLIHNAGLDARILAGAPAFEKALTDNGQSFESFV